MAYPLPSFTIAVLMRFKAQIFNRIPSRITTDWAMGNLGASQPKSARNYIYELKAVGAIDDSGAVTEIGAKLRMNETFREACQLILQTKYPADFIETIADGEGVEDRAYQFLLNKGEGAATARRKAQSYAFLLKGVPVDAAKPRQVQAASARTPSSEGGTGENPVLDLGPSIPSTSMLAVESQPEIPPALMAETFRYWLKDRRVAELRVPLDMTRGERKKLFRHLQIDLMEDTEDESE